jgi:hypothetical protein
MPAYSFKERFIPLIKSGEKRQTIRSKRKHQVEEGDKIYLFYGMRTKFCTRIMDAVCLGVKDISITANGVVRIDGRALMNAEKQKLAKADGFDNFDTMIRWWKQTHKLPFTGDIIYW